MKRLSIGLILVLFAVGVILANRFVRQGTQGDRESTASVQGKPYILDVSNPDCFFASHLKERAIAPEQEGLLVAAIDGKATVHIRNSKINPKNKAIVPIDVVLITGSLGVSGQEARKHDIHLLGGPLALDDAYALARQLCAAAGIDDTNVVKWRRAQANNKSVGNACLQTGTAPGGFDHAIEIHESLSLDRSKPWAIDYQIYFPAPTR